MIFKKITRVLVAPVVLILCCSLISENTRANNSDSSTIEVSNFKRFSTDNNWCWAAVVQMVLYQERNNAPKSCEVVSTYLNKNCCGFFTPNECLVGAPAEPSLQRFGIDTIRYAPGIPALNAIMNGINQNRLPILRFRNIGMPSGHVVVVTGMRNVGTPSPIFEIYDPSSGYTNLEVYPLMHGSIYAPVGQPQMVLDYVLVPR